jgi:hypothetical protein
MAQLVEYVPSECEALKSIPNTAKKQNKTKQKPKVEILCSVKDI